MTKCAVEKSSASLFVACESDPKFSEADTCVCTKEEMMEYIDAYSDYTPTEDELNDYTHGEIFCELEPIAFVYADDQGELVDGKVGKDDMIKMLRMQTQIYNGDLPPVKLTGVYDQDVQAEHMQYDSTECFATDSGAATIGAYIVEDILEDKGCYFEWEAGICYLTTPDGKEKEIAPCGFDPKYGLPLYDVGEVVGI